VNISSLDNDIIKYSLLLLSKRFNYNRWIYNNIKDFIGDNVLEVGAGIGNITDFIIFKKNLTLIDIDPNYIDYLHNKFFSRDKSGFNVFQMDIQNIASSPISEMQFDTIICLNILEHLNNDRMAVENVSSLLNRGGRLIILVPALKALYGSMDVSFEHLRRYSKKDLRLLIHEQNLEIIKLRYMNFMGLLGWFFNGRIFKKTELPEKQTKLFDRLVPTLEFAEKIMKPPLGQSLILVAQKK